MYRNVTTKCPVQLSYTNKNTLKKKKGLVEWLKVWTLSSNPSTTKKEKKLQTL
jgi:hypothetical protein